MLRHFLNTIYKNFIDNEEQSTAYNMSQKKKLTMPFKIDHIQLFHETKQTITKHMDEKYYLREDFFYKKKTKKKSLLRMV